MNRLLFILIGCIFSNAQCSCQSNSGLQLSAHELNDSAVYMIAHSKTDSTLRTALKLVNQAIELDSLYHWSYLSKYQIFLNLDSCIEAKKTLNELVKYHADLPEYTFQYGILLDILNKPDSALFYYLKAKNQYTEILQDQPDNFGALINKTLISFFIDDSTKAFSELLELEISHPNNEQLTQFIKIFKDFNKHEYLSSICSCD